MPKSLNSTPAVIPAKAGIHAYIPVGELSLE